MPLTRIDQTSEQGLELQKVVQTKLKDFLGSEYADDVLPLYIVVMLAHGNNQALVTENLEAFLGNDSVDFAKWLFAHLQEHGHKYNVPEPEEEPEDDLETEEQAIGDGEGEAGGADGDGVAAEPVSPEDGRQEPGRDRRHGAIEWRGDGGHSRHHRSERPREDKRSRDEPPRLERRSSHNRDREADEDRDAKRRRRDMRELKPLDAGREDRARERDRPRNDERFSREERDRERYEWERQQRREAQRAEMDRGREHRDHREMRDRDRDRARDRPRDRDRDLDRRPRQRAYMDSYEHEPMAASAPPRRREKAERMDHHDHENGGGLNGHVQLESPVVPREPPTVKSRVEPVRHEKELDAETEAARGNVFDRLGRNRDRPYMSPAAARKSVFDRLRGNRQLAPKAEDVDPEAVTDDEEPPAGRVTQGNAKPALQPVAIAAKALNGIKPAPSQGKAGDLAEMKRKMLELQEQVRLLERQQRPGAAASTIGPLGAVSAAASLGLPPVNLRSVHVQGVSPLAVPEVVAAHFSGCGRVINVTIARDLQGLPRGFAHVEFSNELEAQNALLLSDSILLQQPITVTPKLNRPPPALTPHYGRGRGGLGAGPGVFPGSGRGGPFSSRGGGAFRGRGRAPQPLTNHKYVRPELRAELEKEKSGVGQSMAAAAESPAI